MGVWGRGYGFLPTQINGCVAWYRADLGVTLTSSGSVSNWADQSGNGFNAVQATAAQQFAYQPNGGPNGTAVVVGNNANITLMTAPIGTLTKPTWVWMVLKYNSTTLGDVLDGQTVNQLRTLNGGASTTIAIQSPASITAPVATNLVYAAYGFTYGLNGSIYINGVPFVTGTTGTNVTSTGLTIGAAGNGSQAADASIAEVVIYNTVPPLSAMNMMSAYSQARYGFG